jgi:hypothetical protein
MGVVRDEITGYLPQREAAAALASERSGNDKTTYKCSDIMTATGTGPEFSSTPPGTVSQLASCSAQAAPPWSTINALNNGWVSSTNDTITYNGNTIKQSGKCDTPMTVAQCDAVAPEGTSLTSTNVAAPAGCFKWTDGTIYHKAGPSGGDCSRDRGCICAT